MSRIDWWRIYRGESAGEADARLALHLARRIGEIMAAL
jgi:hypothetical protein